MWWTEKQLEATRLKMAGPTPRDAKGFTSLHHGRLIIAGDKRPLLGEEITVAFVPGD